MNNTGEQLMKILPKWVFIPGAALAFVLACNKQAARTEHPTTTTNSGTAHEIAGPTNLQVAGVVFYGDSVPASFVKVAIAGTNRQTIQETETDSAGHFVFKDLGPGPLIVEVNKNYEVVGKSVLIRPVVPNRYASAGVSAGDTNVVMHIIGGLP
jgi:hypothetical protein